MFFALFGVNSFLTFLRYPQTMDRELKALQSITDYCVTGTPPVGVRPQVASLLADIISLFD